MNDLDFNFYLSWLLLINAIPPLFGAYICACYFRLVERNVSKVIFAIGFVMMLTMAIFRITSAFDFENYPMRLLNAVIVVCGGLMGNFLFFWSYQVQKRERLKVSKMEQVIREKNLVGFADGVIYSVSPEKINDYISELHPSDVIRLTEKLKGMKGLRH